MTTNSSVVLHRSEDRGPTNMGWLRSMHSFSFGGYYNPDMMGYRSLRVINDYRVAPGMGFGTHPHRDMEIFSYVLDGSLQHRDSMGNGATLRRGDVQLMSAGSGITHSEFNGSKSDPVHFLQIWIEPHTDGLAPTYQERHVSDDEKRGQWVTLMSPEGQNGSLTIQQDAVVSNTILRDGDELTLTLEDGRYGWLHVADGVVDVDGQSLGAGDALSFRGPVTMKIAAAEFGELLMFDLA